jgi:hypothetical protein
MGGSISPTHHRASSQRGIVNLMGDRYNFSRFEQR